MKSFRVAFFAAVALAAAPAVAFTIQGGDGPADNSARYADPDEKLPQRSEEHTSELQSHSEISYAVFCLKKKKI